MYLREFKVYPSACGVVKEGKVVTSKSHICLRNQWFKHHGVKTGDINNVYKLIGDYWEARTAKDLRSGRLDEVISGELKIEAEKSIRKNIGEVPTSGRGDFILTDSSGEVSVIECKAVTSSGRRLKCIRNRKPDDAHVTQIVVTMLLAGSVIGELRYAYVHIDNEGKDFMIPACTEKGKNRATMPVSIVDHSVILVDGEEWGTVEEIYAFMLKADKEVPGETLPDRPYEDALNPYESPCNRCVFSDVCDKTDANEMSEGTHLAKNQLLEEAQEAADAERPFTPKLFKPKRFVEGD